MKYFVSLLVCFLAFNSALKAQLNDYKYIVVPKKFDAFKRDNEHQTSTLIKYLFAEKGYNTVYEGNFPEELRNNPCLALRVNLKDESSLFRTKTTILLQDCELKTVFATREGTSKIKDFKESYEDAIRKAFSSFDLVTYTYTPKKEEKSAETVTISFKNDVKRLDDGQKEEMVQQTATVEEQSYKSNLPEESTVIKANTETMAPKEPSALDATLLYALKTENGYNLADANANIKYKLIGTSVDAIFLLDDEGQNGVVFKKEDKWFLESVVDGKKALQELNIKF